MNNPLKRLLHKDSSFGSQSIPPNRRDVQDDPAYWNVPARLLQDTCKATLEQVRKNPLAGYEDADIGNLETIEVLYDWCIRHNVAENGNVLELGCGGGRMLLIWSAMRTRYATSHCLYGCDHAPDAVAIAEARFEGLGKQCTFFPCAGADLEVTRRKEGFPSFDVIFTHTCLQHNSGAKQHAILTAIWNALRKGGILYLWNEKTFSSWEDPEIVQGVCNPWYHDDRESAGTAAWWVNTIVPYGFELLEYHRSSYTFRKIG